MNVSMTGQDFKVCFVYIQIIKLFRKLMQKYIIKCQDGRVV